MNLEEMNKLLNAERDSALARAARMERRSRMIATAIDMIVFAISVTLTFLLLGGVFASAVSSLPLIWR